MSAAAMAWVFMPLAFLNAICAARLWAEGKPGWAGAYGAGFAFSVIGFAKAVTL